MKKNWMFLLLTPLASLSAGFPIYDEVFDASDDFEMNAPGDVIASESYYEDFNQEIYAEEFGQDDSLVYDDEALGEDVYIAPKKRSKNHSSGELTLSPKREQKTAKAKVAEPKQKRTPVKALKRSTSKNSGAPVTGTVSRSKMKDARENTNRPRVTHRTQKQVAPNVEQMEADVESEEHSYNPQNEPVRKSYRPSKESNNQAFAEKQSGQVQRRSSFRQKGVKSRAYRQASKKEDDKAKSHSGKRPLSE